MNVDLEAQLWRRLQKKSRTQKAFQQTARVLYKGTGGAYKMVRDVFAGSVASYSARDAKDQYNKWRKGKRRRDPEEMEEKKETTAKKKKEDSTALVPYEEKDADVIHYEKRMPARRSTGKRRRRKRGYRRNKRRRRTRTRSRLSRSAMRARLLDLLAAPRTRKSVRTHLIFNPTVSGNATMFMSVPLNDQKQYRMLIDSTGQGSEVFGTNNINDQMHQVFAAQFNKIRNNTDTKCYIKAWLCVPKYNFKDDTFSENQVYTSSNTILNRVRNYMLAHMNGNDDVHVLGLTAGDEVDSRHGAFFECKSTMDPVNRNFLQMFKIIKPFKTRVLEAGKTTFYKYSSKKIRKILPEVHTLVSPASAGPLFPGRTVFFLFKVWGPLVGTNEIEGVNEENEKVSSGYYQVHHEMISTMTMKKLSPSTALHEHDDYRGDILQNDERGIVDVAHDLDQQEYNN
jgi:hypothetical protein